MFGSWNPSQYLALNDTLGSKLVKLAGGYCALQGILCSSSASLILQVWDTPTDNTNSNAVLVQDQLTLTAGQSYPMPAKINLGLYIKVISGTGKYTVYYD